MDNITFEGPWLDNDKAAVQAAVATVALRLAERLGLEPDAAQARVFAMPVEFAAAGGLVNGHYAYAKKNKITVMRGRASEALIIHELGHVIQHLAALRFGNNASPCKMLPRGLPYQRSYKLRAPDNGYVSDRWRDGYQMHPLGMPGWSKAEEQWADMWLNWVRRAFADNDNGRALYEFVEQQIGAWQ